jgi:hypothetical protein
MAVHTPAFHQKIMYHNVTDQLASCTQFDSSEPRRLAYTSTGASGTN